jgi:hypothetical protein
MQNFSGVISRLVQKEKEVIELQNKLANVEHSTRDDSDAKKDRSNQSKRWESLLQEIGTYKVKVSFDIFFDHSSARGAYGRFE